MKLTRFFSKKSASKAKDKKTKDFDSDSATLDSRSSTCFSEVSVNFAYKERLSITEGERTHPRSTCEDVVQKFIAAMNQRCTETEYLNFYASPTTPVDFEDNTSTTAEELAADMAKVFASFQDFKMTYSYIREYKPGTVAVEKVVFSGTHNGSPFAIGSFPPVAATNKHVFLHEQMMFLTIEDGKITKNKIFSLGQLTGPVGFYQAIGGEI
jgi:ketosteroid isomerase-like protein